MGLWESTSLSKLTDSEQDWEVTGGGRGEIWRHCGTISGCVVGTAAPWAWEKGRAGPVTPLHLWSQPSAGAHPPAEH